MLALGLGFPATEAGQWKSYSRFEKKFLKKKLDQEELS